MTRVARATPDATRVVERRLPAKLDPANGQVLSDILVTGAFNTASA
jgi:hypothetical protein